MTKIFKTIASALLALAFVAGVPARAAVLYAGSEDIDFTCTGACTVVTSGGGTNYRTAWVREAYSVSGSGATSDPPTNRFATAVFASTQEIWLHFQYNQGSSATDSNAQVIRLTDDAGNAAIIVRGTGSTGQVKISSRTSGGVFTDLATCTASTFPSGSLQQIDLHAKLAVSGQLDLYAGGVSICTFTGDTTNGDGSTLWTKASVAGLKSTDTSYYSEVIVEDASTLSKNYLALYPNASGNQTQWTGANPCTTILNATAVNDATFVSTSTNSQTEQCATYNTIPSGIYSVDAVQMSARAQRGASGPQHFDFVTRTASTDFYSSDQAPTTSFTNFQNYLQATNPNTSAAWLTSDLTAAGFNIGLFSKP